MAKTYVGEIDDGFTCVHCDHEWYAEVEVDVTEILVCPICKSEMMIVWDWSYDEHNEVTIWYILLLEERP